jgi:hypothetical protein
VIRGGDELRGRRFNVRLRPRIFLEYEAAATSVLLRWGLSTVRHWPPVKSKT